MGSGGGNTTSTVTQTLSPEQRDILNAMKAKYMPGGVAPDRPDWTSTQIQNRGSSLVQPLDTRHTTAVGKVDALTARGGAQPYIDQSRGILTGQSGFSGSTNNAGTSTGAFSSAEIARFQNPYNEQVLDRGLANIDRQSLIGLNQLRGNAASSRAFGGDRMGVAEGVHTGEMARHAGDFTAQILHQGWGQALAAREAEKGTNVQNLQAAQGIHDLNTRHEFQRAQSLAGLGMQDIEATKQLAGLNTEAGNVYRDHAQSIIDVGRTDLQNEHQYGLGIGTAMTGFVPGPTTTTTTTQPKPNLGMAALGVGLNMLPTLLGLSDERAKKDVRKRDPESVLETFRRIDAYDFKYNDKGLAVGGAKGKRTGPMAREMRDAGFKTAAGPGGFEYIDIMDAVGKLMVAVKGLEARTRDGRRRA